MINLSDSIKQISSAVLRLSTAIPGVSRVETWTLYGQNRIDFVVESDELVVAFIEALNMERVDTVSVCKTSAWIAGRVKVDGIDIRVSGPHRPVDQVSPAVVDTSAVADALARAVEAQL